jgi:predicted HicB family RNase H-like nuclease
MIADEKQIEIMQAAEQLYALRPHWVMFYRETFGLRGIVRQLFPTREALAAFEQTEAYHQIQCLLTKLREQDAVDMETGEEPTRVITVRLPKSLHESLRAEAFEHCTSMNKLCISKLLQLIDSEKVPAEI